MASSHIRSHCPPAATKGTADLLFFSAAFDLILLPSACYFCNNIRHTTKISYGCTIAIYIHLALRYQCDNLGLAYCSGCFYSERVGGIGVGQMRQGQRDAFVVPNISFRKLKKH